ncbi:type II and III secretion system protein family protein [Massilia sp. S19_KUP03_FR1]|uniref:type II and III secretion system protein family protein n=1 Tax=Massilia sp. S19_KUP03_FR1 TaxID=3025503 RepID=UPI002FCDC75F
MNSRLTMLPLAGVLLASASALAAPASEPAKAQPRCSGTAAKPAQLALYMGKSTMMRLPEGVIHRSVGNPDVVQAMLVAPDTLYIAGIDVGTTNMIIQGKSGACSVVDVTVAMDPAALRSTLAAALPDEKNIVVSTAADTIILSGTVLDATVVARAGELAAAYVRRPVRALQGTKDDASTAAPAAPAAAGVRVVNMLAVSAPQQVLLEVKIAEVSKTLLNKLEGGSRFNFSRGSWTAMVLSKFLTGNASAGIGGVSTKNGNELELDADKRDSLVRMLAEPNVMAISGQEGSFLAGGKFYIPVSQENNRITLEEKEFGVGLRFTPTVLGGGRINLRVAPEVSELSREGIGVSAQGITGAAILPLVTTRRASTTVQLYDGQSFAIGGLIKNNMVGSLKALPGLGEVPILGALFRSTDYQQDRTELVFVITARLVKPLPQNYSLPTDGLIPPSPAELMLLGKLEGTAAPAPATPAQGTVQSGAGFELK